MNENFEEKKQKIRDEVDRLKIEMKVELPKRIAHARSLGDLKENAEYHAARERQSFVKAQISQLNGQLGQLNNMKLAEIKKDSVDFGSLVTVVDLDTAGRQEFTLVHPGEVDPSAGRISLSSPIGRSLQNRTAGDTVEVTIPAGKKRFYIEKLTTFHGDIFEKKREP